MPCPYRPLAACRIYYWNESTDEVTWTKPVKPSRYGGIGEDCIICAKTVYLAERRVAGGATYHAECAPPRTATPSPHLCSERICTVAVPALSNPCSSVPSGHSRSYARLHLVHLS